MIDKKNIELRNSKKNKKISVVEPDLNNNNNNPNDNSAPELLSKDFMATLNSEDFDRGEYILELRVVVNGIIIKKKELIIKINDSVEDFVLNKPSDDDDDDDDGNSGSDNEPPKDFGFGDPSDGNNNGGNANTRDFGFGNQSDGNNNVDGTRDGSSGVTDRNTNIPRRT